MAAIRCRTFFYWSKRIFLGKTVKQTVKRALVGSALLALNVFAAAPGAIATPITVLGTADIWAWNGIAPPDDQTGSPIVSIAPVLAISNLSGIGSVMITA